MYGSTTLSALATLGDYLPAAVIGRVQVENVHLCEGHGVDEIVQEREGEYSPAGIDHQASPPEERSTRETGAACEKVYSLLR
jgi:hypothetical protein